MAHGSRPLTLGDELLLVPSRVHVLPAYKLSRLLAPTSIPAVLWDGATSILSAPPALSSAYLKVIGQLGLHALAVAADPDSHPAGGPTPEATHLHFAQRFEASCGRTALVALDPMGMFADASDRLIAALAGGRVAILDIPCGAGAAILSLLTTIAALRRHGALPRLPLTLDVLGGDVSATAFDIAGQQLELVRLELEEQGIVVNAVWQRWDVRDAESTHSLMARWADVSRDARSCIVLATNFSAFLGRPENFKKAQAQLEQVLFWVKTRRATVVWIEPQTKPATTFFGSIWTKFRSFLNFLSGAPRSEGSDPPVLLGESWLTSCIKVAPFRIRVSLLLLRAEAAP